MACFNIEYETNAIIIIVMTLKFLDGSYFELGNLHYPK